MTVPTFIISLNIFLFSLISLFYLNFFSFIRTFNFFVEIIVFLIFQLFTFVLIFFFFSSTNFSFLNFFEGYLCQKFYHAVFTFFSWLWFLKIFFPFLLFPFLRSTIASIPSCYFYFLFYIIEKKIFFPSIYCTQFFRGIFANIPLYYSFFLWIIRWRILQLHHRDFFIGVTAHASPWMLRNLLILESLKNFTRLSFKKQISQCCLNDIWLDKECSLTRLFCFSHLNMVIL